MVDVKTIGITFNLKNKGKPDDQCEEYDEIETIYSLKREIEKYGFKVLLFEQNENFLKQILKLKPDFIFNIAEGIGNTRARESQIPCILESLGLPYSGSDPISLGITLDKYVTNCILKSDGIPVPLMFMAEDAKDILSLKNIFIRKKVYVVKPRWEGSSKGIFSNSVVGNFKELKDRVLNILFKYKQPALVEEFLEKAEISVGVCGNGDARLLGMVKITPKESQKYFLYSIENKRDWRAKIRYEPQETIPERIQGLIEKYALKTYKTLELRDISRIDFRLDSKNMPKVIDVNPLPGMSPVYSDLPILYKLKGGSYSELVKIILRESLKRYGFKLK